MSVDACTDRASTDHTRRTQHRAYLQHRPRPGPRWPPPAAASGSTTARARPCDRYSLGSFRPAGSFINIILVLVAVRRAPCLRSDCPERMPFWRRKAVPIVTQQQIVTPTNLSYGQASRFRIGSYRYSILYTNLKRYDMIRYGSLLLSNRYDTIFYQYDPNLRHKHHHRHLGTNHISYRIGAFAAATHIVQYRIY